jgi:hypothetical protein
MPALTSTEIRTMMSIPCSIFIETGTYLGQTTEIAASMFEKVHTIEVKNDLFISAKNKLSRYPNVVCHLGDSSILLEDICKKLTKSSCFWLDGHYSAGNTGKGSKNVPLYEELQTIMKNCSQECIILIDDCRLFEKTDPYVDGWEAINVETILEIVKPRLVSYSFFPSALNPKDRLSIVLHK